jgi:serine/threonine protein phosphatase PrpC
MNGIRWITVPEMSTKTKGLTNEVDNNSIYSASVTVGTESTATSEEQVVVSDVMEVDTDVEAEQQQFSLPTILVPKSRLTLMLSPTSANSVCDFMRGCLETEEEEELVSRLIAPNGTVLCDFGRSHVIRQVHINRFAANEYIEDRSREFVSGDKACFAVFDGHGGYYCSQFLSDYLIPTIEHQIYKICSYRKHSIAKRSWLNDLLHYKEDDWKLLERQQKNDKQMAYCAKLSQYFDNSKAIKMALENAFRRTDEMYIKHVIVKTSNQKNIDIGDLSGSCAIVTYFCGTKMFVANTGDCRCVLARRQPDGTLQAIACSNDHKATEKQEEERLRKQFPDEHDIIYGGRVKGKLEPTRAFGDVLFKQKLFSQAQPELLGRRYRKWNPPYITVDPEITEFDIDPEKDEFAILGTDGLFDFLSNQEIVDIVHQHMQNQPSEEAETTTTNVCDTLIKRVLLKAMEPLSNLDNKTKLQYLLTLHPDCRRNVYDDITITVIFFNKQIQKGTKRFSLARCDSFEKEPDLFEIVSNTFQQLFQDMHKQ